MARTDSSLTSSATSIERVEQTLHAYFDERTESAQRISPYYGRLWYHMRRLVLSGGKRLRPKMVLLAYDAFGGEDTDAVVPIAAALELLHASLLMHDDIIDRDYVRYGVQNVAGGYRKEYLELVQDPTERTHFANSAALLSGDLLLSGSYQLITQSTLSAADRILAQQLMSDAIFEVAGGELLDTESTFRPNGAIPSELVSTYKTASYTFVTPLLIGATLAGIATEQTVLLRIFGETLGTAFQLQDDLLGVFGDTKQTGKSTMGDLREGKRTYMVEQFYAHADPAQQKAFATLFGQETLSAAEAEILRGLLIESGAKQRTEEAIAGYVNRARQSLSQLAVSETCREQFAQLIEIAVRRVK